MDNAFNSWLSTIERSFKEYHGRIWGKLPDDFPMSELEQIYRNCIGIIGAEQMSVRLMGMGFAATAFRFRTMAENDEIFTTSILQKGCAPCNDDYYKQEAALYIFFTAGFSCLESFFFAMHALASYYKPDKFSLNSNVLSKVGYSQVKDQYSKYWKTSDLSIAMEQLIISDNFSEWKEMRNILTHRAVIPRDVTFNCKDNKISADSSLEKTGSNKSNIPINDKTTCVRRAWLSEKITILAESLSTFIKR